MDSSALMVLLVLMGMVYCRPSEPACQNPCSPAGKFHSSLFQHVSDLQHSSVAPWNLVFNTTEDREPQIIKHAVCENCTVKDMVAKPIFIQIQVYKRLRNDSWCRCPYNLAVGCTCVREKRQ